MYGGAVHLGQRIKAWRQHAGLTKSAVADALHIRPPAVAQWELDDVEERTEPTHSNLEAFVSLCGITMSRFWGDPPKPKKAA